MKQRQNRIITIAVNLLFATTCGTAVANPLIDLTRLIAPGTWQISFRYYSSDTPGKRDYLSSDTRLVCVRKAFLKDALNWSSEFGGKPFKTKQALSASLSGNHLHIDWIPQKHSDWSREDAYFDDPAHLHGQNEARFYPGSADFEHVAIVEVKAHQIAKQCLGLRQPDYLWRLIAFPDG